MPEERWEWLVFWLGVAVAVALVALIVLGDRSRTPVGTASASPQTTTSARTTPRPSTQPAATLPTTTTSRQPKPAPSAVTLRLKARRDTWLSVRRTSSGRRLLWQGTLVAGADRTFSGTSFEVRFGAAANVEATLNGKPLRLPNGTYSVTVGRAGLGPRKA